MKKSDLTMPLDWLMPDESGHDKVVMRSHFDLSTLSPFQRFLVVALRPFAKSSNIAARWRSDMLYRAYREEHVS